MLKFIKISKLEGFYWDIALPYRKWWISQSTCITVKLAENLINSLPCMYCFLFTNGSFLKTSSYLTLFPYPYPMPFWVTGEFWFYFVVDSVTFVVLSSERIGLGTSTACLHFGIGTTLEKIWAKPRWGVDIGPRSPLWLLSFKPGKHFIQIKK